MLKGDSFEPQIMPVKSDEKHYQIAFNAIPQIDKFQENGFTFEEMKMINETKKSCTCLNFKYQRLASDCLIATGHSESVYIETDRDDVTAEDIKNLLKEAPGVVLQDDPSEQVYPMPADAVGKRDVFVGRVRKDLDRPNGFHLWIVSDNLLKGAAWNSVQIAESLKALNLV
ncbi:Asd/ArgC dimerization domain-containing protein [Bacillus sonorensis]|nr:Asd/ArgC dimerization domain-containing protein [Bacillus sonorensis]